MEREEVAETVSNSILNGWHLSGKGQGKKEELHYSLYKLYRISDDLLIQRNKKVEAQPRPFYSSELVNRLKSYTTCSKK